MRPGAQPAEIWIPNGAAAFDAAPPDGMLPKLADAPTTATHGSALESVALTVGAVPNGWGTTLRGGGFVIGAITAGTPDKPAVASLEVRIPPSAKPGDYPLVVSGAGTDGTSNLRVDLTVANQVDAGIGVTADFPSLRGDPTSTFTYNLTIANNTPASQTFTFDPSGPQGWEVTASPSAQAQANTVTVDAGDSAQVKVEAKPPASVAQGSYPIEVGVTSAAGAKGSIELTAEVTGAPKMEVTTADQRLNVSGQADEVGRRVWAKALESGSVKVPRLPRS